MQLFFSWYLLLPAVMYVLYEYGQYRSMAAMGIAVSQVRIQWLAAALSGIALTVAWSAVDFPLPVLYLLTFLLRAARIVGGRTDRRKAWFLLNLSFVNTMALHLALIGAVSLVFGVTMHGLLDFGFWRTMSTTAVLGADFIESLVFLRWPNLPARLAAEAESEEARPFMAFLWFCTGYLLVDSFLCEAELEPLYPPLFLIGSIAAMMYFVIRFLLHINAIIRDEYLKDENDRLSARLEAARESAGSLKRIVDRDVLTGAFSRRKMIGHINVLIEGGRSFSLTFLDLDGLKRINDNEGHDAGDRHLIGFTKAMEARLREGDLLARVGGDEFVILMPDCEGAEAEGRIADIRTVLETRSREGEPLRFSYGVTTFLPGDERDAEELLQAADQAMYQDKERRKRGVYLC